MSEPSAQYVEPAELRMLRNSLAATCANLEAIEYQLLVALRDNRRALDRVRCNQSWVRAVDINITQEQRS